MLPIHNYNFPKPGGNEKHIFHDSKITNAAAVKSNDKELIQSSAQTEKDQSTATSDWNGERVILEYCCVPNSKIGNPVNCIDNSVELYDILKMRV
eukprot:403886-Pyramimonas_sp.AAC.1